MKKIAPLCCGLLLALAGSLCAAETALIGAQTPWRVSLRMGPYVARKNGELTGARSAATWQQPPAAKRKAGSVGLAR